MSRICTSVAPSTATHFTHKNKYSITVHRAAVHRRVAHTHDHCIHSSSLPPPPPSRCTLYIQFNYGLWAEIPFQISFNLKLMALLQTRAGENVAYGQCQCVCLFYFRPGIGALLPVQCPLCCSNEQLKFHHTTLSRTHTHTHSHGRHTEDERRTYLYRRFIQHNTFTHCQLHISIPMMLKIFGFVCTQKMSDNGRKRAVCVCVCDFVLRINFGKITTHNIGRSDRRNTLTCCIKH